MPYLPLDLDAKHIAHGIERALGLPHTRIVGGLMDMWEVVWRNKKDVIDGLALSGCFGLDERIPAALVAREFLEPVDGGYRVRGAAKWLFGMEGKSRGGHAAKANLVPGAKQKSAEKPKEVLSASAEAQPRPPLGALSALSPSIPASQHPAPSIPIDEPAQETAPAKVTRRRRASAAPKKEPNPRHGPLMKRLKAVFLEVKGVEYDADGADSAAVTKLCKRTESDDEVERRWRRALTTRGHPGTSSLVTFNARWNELGGQQATLLDVTRGVARADDSTWTEEQLKRFNAGGVT